MERGWYYRDYGIYTIPLTAIAPVIGTAILMLRSEFWIKAINDYRFLDIQLWLTLGAGFYVAFLGIYKEITDDCGGAVEILS